LAQTPSSKETSVKTKFSSRSLALTVFAVASTALSIPGQASAGSSLMPTGAEVAAPYGFIEFCQREPLECAPANSQGAIAPPHIAPPHIIRANFWRVLFSAQRDDARLVRITSGPSVDVLPAQIAGAKPDASNVVALTGANWAQIYNINRYVNKAIRPRSDRDLFGSESHWDMPLEPGRTREGDCKDYALEKRHLLIKKGFDPSALSIATLDTPTGVRHAVLLVATDHGELVLDSLSSWVVRWDQTPYRWVARQSAGDPMVWVKADPKIQLSWADERSRKL